MRKSRIARTEENTVNLQPSSRGSTFLRTTASGFKLLHHLDPPLGNTLVTTRTNAKSQLSLNFGQPTEGKDGFRKDLLSAILSTEWKTEPTMAKAGSLLYKVKERITKNKLEKIHFGDDKRQTVTDSLIDPSTGLKIAKGSEMARNIALQQMFTAAYKADADACKLVGEDNFKSVIELSKLSAQESVLANDSSMGKLRMKNLAERTKKIIQIITEYFATLINKYVREEDRAGHKLVTDLLKQGLALHLDLLKEVAEMGFAKNNHTRSIDTDEIDKRALKDLSEWINVITQHYSKEFRAEIPPIDTDPHLLEEEYQRKVPSTSSPTRTRDVRMKQNSTSKFKSPSTISLTHRPEDSAAGLLSSPLGLVATQSTQPQALKTTKGTVDFFTSRLQAYLSLNGYHNLNTLITQMAQMLDSSLECLNEHKGLIQTAQLKSSLAEKLTKTLQDETVGAIKRREDEIKSLKAKK